MARRARPRGIDDFGERFLRRVLEVWDDERTGGALVALVRSAQVHRRPTSGCAFVQSEVSHAIAARSTSPTPTGAPPVRLSQPIGLPLVPQPLTSHLDADGP